MSDRRLPASARLWSPQLRKWQRDAYQHGFRITPKRRPEVGGGAFGAAGGGVAYVSRTVDIPDGGLRILDGPGNLRRSIDHP